MEKILTTKVPRRVDFSPIIVRITNLSTFREGRVRLFDNAFKKGNMLKIEVVHPHNTKYELLSSLMEKVPLLISKTHIELVAGKSTQFKHKLNVVGKAKGAKPSFVLPFAPPGKRHFASTIYVNSDDFRMGHDILPELILEPSTVLDLSFFVAHTTVNLPPTARYRRVKIETTHE